MKNLFSLSPLGGVDEIGSNMTLIETDHYGVIIDVGILFPYEDSFDINYLIPNFENIPKDKEIILLITHGHEDHIGAIYHFIMKYPEVKIYAPLFAKKLILKKLFENNKMSFKIEEYTEKSKLKYDNLEFSFVKVNHSIPDTYGVLFRDDLKLYSASFISDFKVDLKTKYEDAINFKKIKTWHKEHLYKFAFLDSTNILKNNKTPSEFDLIEDLETYIKIRNKRVLITLFASNLHRIKTILNLAKKHKKKVVIVGRSLNNYIELAQEVKLIDPDFPLFNMDQIENLNSNNLLFLLTGCQGEFKGSLRRYASHESKLKPTKDDLLLFSSKAIPGNEKKIYRIINELTNAGVEVITSSDALIHASGHPGQEDIKEFIKNTKPTHYVPIHGESFFLKRHESFIKNNFPKIKTELIHNFDKIEFFKKTYKIKKGEKKSPILIHGSYLEIEKEKISERRKLATTGIIFITLSKKEIFLTHLGLPLIFNESIPKIEELVFTSYRKINQAHPSKIQDELKIITRRFVNTLLGYKPQVVVHLC